MVSNQLVLHRGAGALKLRPDSPAEVMRPQPEKCQFALEVPLCEIWTEAMGCLI